MTTTIKCPHCEKTLIECSDCRKRCRVGYCSNHHRNHERHRRFRINEFNRRGVSP